MAKKKFVMRQCPNCGELRSSSDYLPTSSPFFIDGYLTICTECLIDMFDSADDWNALDRICQWADWPFLPEEWTKLSVNDGPRALKNYGLIFRGQTYGDRLNWRDQNEKWRLLQEDNKLDKAHNELQLANMAELAKKWQGTYLPDELEYLEDTLEGLQRTYGAAPGLQADQALKLCKISLLIDQRIREGQKFDDLIKGYNSLIEMGGFTAKNAANANDFESVGELFAYVEKKGFMNKFYDNVSRDIVDETMMNMQAYTRRIVMGEANIQDQVNDKLRAYKLSRIIEDKMDVDQYEDDGYTLRAADKFETQGTIDEITYDVNEEDEFHAEED